MAEPPPRPLRGDSGQDASGLNPTSVAFEEGVRRWRTRAVAALIPQNSAHPPEFSWLISQSLKRENRQNAPGKRAAQRAPEVVRANHASMAGSKRKRISTIAIPAV